jgi:hypothetical protein
MAALERHMLALHQRASIQIVCDVILRRNRIAGNLSLCIFIMKIFKMWHCAVRYVQAF